MNKCHLEKVKDKSNLYQDPPKGIWFGWCDVCHIRTAQYWNFGAALGATLYHITVHHRGI